MHRDALLYEAASLYYLQEQTMDAIAARFGVSRSTVSRMLREAREGGLVRITLAPPEAVASPLAKRLQERFDVSPSVVPLRDATSLASRLDAVARQAASLLGDLVDDGVSIGVAWGTTITAVSTHLPARPVRDACIVQLNGAAGIATSGTTYAGEILMRFAHAFDAQVHHFPTPAFFDHASTRRALWRESAVQRVLDLHQNLDVAIFGVGTLEGPAVSHVYAAGYLSPEDMETAQAMGAVGDVCTVLLREDGTWADIPLNARASGPTPDVLRTLPRRIAVISGAHRARTTLGALRAGVITDLVIDEQTARAVLARDDQTRRR